MSDEEQMQTEWARLSVNMHDDVAAVLKARMVKDGISATEAVRRAVTVWDFCMDNVVLVIGANGKVYEVEGLGVRTGLHKPVSRSWFGRLARVIRGDF